MTNLIRDILYGRRILTIRFAFWFIHTHIERETLNPCLFGGAFSKSDELGSVSRISTDSTSQFLVHYNSYICTATTFKSEVGQEMYFIDVLLSMRSVTVEHLV